jgi:hypothetical protein
MLLQNSLAIAGAGLVAFATAQVTTYPTNLIGTWSTKSKSTVTGPVRICNAILADDIKTDCASPGFLRSSK